LTIPSRTKQRGDYFVWLGRFVPEKGAHLAIEVAKQARVPLVLAGTIDPSLQEVTLYFQKMIEPNIDAHMIKYIGPVDMQQKHIC
jgi:glycosyltransferase involved in cell wall biosynthesis